MIILYILTAAVAGFLFLLTLSKASGSLRTMPRPPQRPSAFTCSEDAPAEDELDVPTYLRRHRFRRIRLTHFEDSAA